MTTPISTRGGVSHSRLALTVGHEAQTMAQLLAHRLNRQTEADARPVAGVVQYWLHTEEVSHVRANV